MKAIILILSIALLVFGLSTSVHPYDYIACFMGGALLPIAFRKDE